MSKNLYSFEPDWTHEVIPGYSISERMEDIGLSQTKLATSTGYSEKHIHNIINGNATINETTALRLEKVLGISANFWSNLEGNYRIALEKEKESKELVNSVNWLREIPLSSMIKFSWVQKFKDKVLQVEECLKFYGVASVDAWHKTQHSNYKVAFKSSDKFSKNDVAIQTWIKQGEKVASSIDCNSFDKELLKNSLDELRRLTLIKNPDDFLPKLKKLCAGFGVAVVFEPTPEKCPMSGATKWITSDKALLLLSVRHKTNDHLWFAFFHEIAHILKHKKQLFLEGKSDFIKNEVLEKEADDFAANTLIPKKYDLKILKTKKSIITFAKEIDIAPGIVVERMQHKELILWSRFNDLKVKYCWK
jgi:addiction module HigA family antidote